MAATGNLVRAPSRNDGARKAKEKDDHTDLHPFLVLLLDAAKVRATALTPKVPKAKESGKEKENGTPAGKAKELTSNLL